ncbi:cobyrinate a,c-diamide synthase [Carboxydothermus hydrogenoformans]|uniref:Cobyrinate a,c-diamide synthase n=1 Tax=Carboxydothermus hydrogenoformans (strain ATCC BAA-161 / DSM 6008 / Z-2901) TaxID=246194 RepID=Q3A9I8_CARHZ|nr:cobyrinate a,c-diamide synthase [Carboxydothermus hydrogenoformans]ABB13732.1 cobyrinic acid a,c-diamide synthase [Carboxydothermus hydrogenoformans Z-2901]
MNPNGIVVAAASGRSGKTTLTLGILRALSRRGIKVQPFKKGPDYIDPGWHTLAAGEQSRNLDLFLHSREEVVNHYRYYAKTAMLSVVEGNMGIFDGVDALGTNSTAELAKLLNLPVLLVVDATRTTRTLAAVVKGLMEFDRDLKVFGVIFNKVGSRRQIKLLEEVFAGYCPVRILGYMPKIGEKGAIVERHLGLITSGEVKTSNDLLDYLSRMVEEHIDLEPIISLASKNIVTVGPKPLGRGEVKIGVFKNEAFCFYYPENLEMLEKAGAEIVFINPFYDELPEELGGLYIGGGFPELYLEELARNRKLLTQVKKYAQLGMPIYAECGGLMYLCDKIKYNGSEYYMAGVIPAECQMTPKPQGHGYTEGEIVRENPYFPVGYCLKGHEFHYSRLNLTEELTFGLKLHKGQGITKGQDGFCYKNVFAAYTHFHVLTYPKWSENFVNAAKNFRVKGGGFNASLAACNF